MKREFVRTGQGAPCSHTREDGKMPNRDDKFNFTGVLMLSFLAASLC